MSSTKRADPLDGFFDDVPIRPGDGEAQRRVRNQRTMSTREYLEWCSWLTRDSVSHARDLHTVPFELFIER